MEVIRSIAKALFIGVAEESTLDLGPIQSESYIIGGELLLSSNPS